MLDIQDIRKDPERIRKALLKRIDDIDFTDLLGWDERRRTLISQTEALKARRNTVSGEIPEKKKQGENVQPLIDEMKEVSGNIKVLDSDLANVERDIKLFMDSLPNVPDDDVPEGGKENNEVLSSWGDKPEFSFEPKDHIDLVADLGLIDYERGVKMGGSGFWLYRGDGALLEWALMNYFIQEHLSDGYEFMLPPHILSYQCGYTAGHFPKFDDDVFYLSHDGDEQPKFLLPTAETALINFHRDEILDEDLLPLKYFAYTPCYRKEAGSYRTQERGMIRGHQFNKVEMFQFTQPEKSAQAFEELVEKAERIVRGLGLHYRLSRLAAKDCSAAAARTFDIEVWLPSMDDYKEVSSVSNTREYQSRRGNIRFKRKTTGKNEYIHALNASGMATSRIFPAILEQHQQEDGSVIVPEVLRGFLKKDRIVPQEGEDGS